MDIELLKKNITICPVCFEKVRSLSNGWVCTIMSTHFEIHIVGSPYSDFVGYKNILFVPDDETYKPIFDYIMKLCHEYAGGDLADQIKIKIENLLAFL